MLGPQYTLGNLVQLARGGRLCPVVWCQQLQERNDYGHVVRYWVYRLDNGHWDCYHEDKLHPALRWGNG